MAVPPEIASWYAENVERLRAVEKQVRNALDNYASKNGFLFAGRVKSVQSLSEKIETGRVAGWSELDDAYAATIVIPTYSREAEVRGFVRSAFVEKRAVTRGQMRKAPGLFRFDATRVYCCLSDRDEATEAERLIFEVQILSAFDYAWQAVTHDLVFKNALVDWRRERLAAQMKALVEQLDAIGENFDLVAEKIPPSSWIEIDAANEITEWINDLVAGSVLPEELKPAASSRTAEMMISSLRSDGVKNENLLLKIRQAMTQIRCFLEAKGLDRVPRSLSLAQIAFGVMYRSGVVSAKVKQRIFLNESVLLEFPELRGYSTFFAV